MRVPMQDALKRGFDVFAAGTGLVALSAPLALIAIAVRWDSTGPALYKSERIGRGGQPFQLLKFRSMRVSDARGPTTTSARDPRITRVGRFLRRYKLDELSQLINVLRGEMSLVGPRPQVRWAVDRFTAQERRILMVRPGMTDWASIRFHNEEEIVSASGDSDPDAAYMRLIHPEKTRLQLEYVHDRSLWQDMRILAATLSTLVNTRGGAGHDARAEGGA